MGKTDFYVFIECVLNSRLIILWRHMSCWGQVVFTLWKSIVFDPFLGYFSSVLVLEDLSNGS